MVFGYDESILRVKNNSINQKGPQNQDGQQSQLKIVHNPFSSNMQFLYVL